MVTTNTPFGEIINYIRNKNIQDIDDILCKEINNLIDLMTIRVQKIGVYKTYESLENDIFKLRFLIINDHKLLTKYYSDLNKTIKERIRLQFDSSTSNHKLELAYISSLDIYGQIAENTFQQNIKKQNPPEKISSYSLADFSNLLKTIPSPHSEYIIRFVRSSILLDYAFLLSELIFDGIIILSKEKINDLVLMLKSSIENYALFAFRLGIWKPNEDEESQYIRNIKIRISLDESLSNNNKFTLDQLHKTLNQ